MDKIIVRLLFLAEKISETRADLRGAGFFHPNKRALKLRLFKYSDEFKTLRGLIRAEEI